MSRYTQAAAFCILILFSPAIYAEEKTGADRQYQSSYSIGSEIIEWGIYTSLYAGAFLIDRNEPLTDKTIIGGSTGKPYKNRDTVPAYWLGEWMAGVYAFIALSPNEDGSFNRITYNNIKGFYEAVAYNHFVTVITKIGIGRKRPSYENYPESEKENDGRKSFISGHSSTAFVIATYSSLYIAEHSGDNNDTVNLLLKGGIIAASFSAATYTAWSRVHDNRHHVSDVIAGGTVGVVSGVTAYMHQNGWFKKLASDDTVSVLPVASDDTAYIAICKTF